MRSAALLLWRARVRGSFPRIVALAVLTAVGGGIALAVAAGAGRTATAYDAVLAITHGAELGTTFGPDFEEQRQRLRDLPAVDGFTQLVGFQTLLPETPVAGLSSFALYEDPVVVERPIVIAGRLPHSANEVALTEGVISAAGSSVGAQINVVLANPDFTAFSPETMAVTGVILDDIYEDETGARPTVVYAKEFVQSHRELVAWGAAEMSVAPHTDKADAVAQLHERGFVIDNDRNRERDKARGAIRPLAVTLGALAGLAALATIVVVGQALRRLVQRSPGDARSLAATGCSRTVLLAADVGVAATVGLAGAIGAVGVAVAASPLFPLGRPRRVPALRGVDVDAAVLGFGAAAMLLALTGVVAAMSLRRTRRGPVRAGSAPGVLGANPAMGTGVRFATGRRGLAGTVAGVAVGLTAIVAAVVFTGSMSGLVSKPELAGFNWDLMGRNSYAVIDTAAVANELRDDKAVERITGLTFADATVKGKPVPVSAWKAVVGSPWPSLVSGRAPQGPNEVLVSQKTLDDLGSGLGDKIAVGFAPGPSGPRVDAGVTEIEMTVVGTAVSPAVGIPGSDTPRLNRGLLVRQEDIASRQVEYGGAVLFDVADGVDPDSVKAQFPNGLPDDSEGLTDWFETAQPAELIQSADAISVVDMAIAVLLIGVMATVAHNLLGFVRERRNAFAVLKALGFTPRQIRSTVLCQSGLVVGLAMVVAVPLGIAAGRWLYQGFAGGIGVIVRPTVPLLALSAAAVGAVVLVQVVALVPARRARRTDAATELRWE